MEDLGIAPTLPISDINLVVLTDVHSWVNGHGTNEGVDNLDVTYGDVVSFAERLKEHCYSQVSECGDLWLVQNGDWIDGTGLATNGDASSLIPLLERIPFDVMNTGNHELYKDSVVEEMRKPGGFLQWWGNRHLASNIYMNSPNVQKNKPLGKQLEPMSTRYTVLKGRQSTVLVFGFIYNLPNPSDLVVVQTVEEAVKEDWFREALTDKTIGYNSILVMLHAGHDDPSVEILRTAIRRITTEAKMEHHEHLSIQFVAGHTHYRRYAVADSQSTVVEAGRYMDTVGWVSFPNSATIALEKFRRRTRERRLANNKLSSFGNFTDSNESMIPSTESPATAAATAAASLGTPPVDSAVTDLFHHVFLDANVATLRESLGLPPRATDGDDDDFQTPLGREVLRFIQQTRDALGLTKHLGCAPRDYQLNVSMAQEDSLWKLHRDEVGPHVLSTVRLMPDKDGSSSAASPPAAADHSHRCLFMSQDNYRYGLFGGDHLTMDDIIVVSPFNEPIYRVAVLPCSTLRQLYERMNAEATVIFYNTLPAWIMAMYPDDTMGATTAAASASELSSNSTASPADDVCELYVNHFGLSRVEQGLKKTGANAEWNPIETSLTTTSIWTSFVEDKWACSGKRAHAGTHVDKDGPPSANVGGGTSIGSKWKESIKNGPLGGTTEVAGIAVLDDDGCLTWNGEIVVSLAALCLLALCLCVVCCCCCRCRRSRRSSSRGYDGVFRDGDYRDGDYRDDGYRDDEIDEEEDYGSNADDGMREDVPVRIV